jgi:hypothetical protein
MLLEVENCVSNPNLTPILVNAFGAISDATLLTLSCSVPSGGKATLAVPFSIGKTPTLGLRVRPEELSQLLLVCSRHQGFDQCDDLRAVETPSWLLRGQTDGSTGDNRHSRIALVLYSR